MVITKAIAFVQFVIIEEADINQTVFVQYVVIEEEIIEAIAFVRYADLGEGIIEPTVLVLCVMRGVNSQSYQSNKRSKTFQARLSYKNCSPNLMD
ncbi:MAG: hypothetical protein GPJ54_14910 [Candidatus Heimdallarchaeota archaeon]|nr:hypothetical protein [Candidatus Heimdallarchaeota archaeon]